MIISPLFLKDKSNSEDDASWVSRMMPVDPERGFPLNSHRSWHGGIHIPHTDSGGTPEKIRAIAEGTVHSPASQSVIKKAFLLITTMALRIAAMFC
ncbi:putative kinase [Yersinia pseudotuberculosis]|nr:putative kinase [Yersinia pseudotuberculosis]